MIDLIFDILIFFCIYAIITISLNFQQGYTGIFNLGLYFPIIIGALIAAFLPGRLGMLIYGIDSKLDFSANNAIVVSILNSKLSQDPIISILLLLLTLIVTILICYILGFLITYPALKLPADYLALFMLCAGESLRVIGMQTDWLAGGVMGIIIMNPFIWLGKFSYYGMGTFIILLTIIIIIIHQRICNSPLGRLLKSIRENELTAKCIGKNVDKIKRKVLSFSFAILGIAGVLHAFSMSAVVVGGYTRVDFSFWPWLMMIVGGTGNNIGVLLGTFSLVMIRRIIIIAKHFFLFLPFSIVWFEPILLALLLLFTLIFKPEGILSEKPLEIKKYIEKVLKLEA
ncbi:MAG: branched-chain amino acid ABC transporter permease [Candidatus Methanomethylicaceae archaeon]